MQNYLLRLLEKQLLLRREVATFFCDSVCYTNKISVLFEYGLFEGK